MSNEYLIKRNPDFTIAGVIVKRNSKNKSYSDTMIASSLRKPYSFKLNVGDRLYVAETQYGIYAEGKVTQVSDIIKFDSVEEILNYIIINRKKDDTYWLDKLKKLQEAKRKKPNTSLKYHEYFIDQKLLDRTIPLIRKLKKFSKPSFGNSFFSLSAEEVEYINNPIFNETKTLQTKIPSNLRMDIYSLLNKNYAVQHWIDIDHFVPKSTLGPGNIIENLVPIGLSLNRYKSNSVPIGLFKEAYKCEDLKSFVLKDFLKSKHKFLSKSKNRYVLDCATKINEYIARNYDISKAKDFYKSVLKYHVPEYVEIIESLGMS
ncbi:MAG: hypothetical protein KAT68_05935 [Bacteroidales bacterium]|nr:hypothetical protein [Bacteroidales bacterium]